MNFLLYKKTTFKSNSNIYSFNLQVALLIFLFFKNYSFVYEKVRPPNQALEKLLPAG